MILDLRIPPTVSARSLCRALARVFDARFGSRRDFSLATGISQVDVSSASTPGRGDARGDSMALRRVAESQGYEPHPGMPGHYRRLVAASWPTPEDDVDEELQRLAAEARAEQEDEHESCDPWLAEQMDRVRCDEFLADLDEAMWRRAAELTPDDLTPADLESEDAL